MQDVYVTCDVINYNALLAATGLLLVYGNTRVTINS